MVEKYKERVVGLLNDARFQVDIPVSGECVLTCGEVSALLKPNDRNKCLVILRCPGWIDQAGLPLEWKPGTLPHIRRFLDEWTSRNLFRHFSLEENYENTIALVLVINRHWSELMAVLIDMKHY